jgi:hypothetical protein
MQNLLLTAILLINLNVFAAQATKDYSSQNYNILGTIAFSNKQEAIAEGWSFNKNNRFKLGEVVGYHIQSGEIIYGRVSIINRSQIKIDFGDGYIIGSRHYSFAQISHDFGFEVYENIGKIQQN